jgi:hypothetical protein
MLQLALSTHFKALFTGRYHQILTAEKLCEEETPKIIVKQSWSAALISVAVHVPSVAITTFLLVWNWRTWLNGPPIVSYASFGLQVASKVHVSARSSSQAY